MSNPYQPAKQKNQSVLGPTLRFKGKLSAEEDLLIQGQLEGSIKHSSNLTIGKEGSVKADISAEQIAVEGKVEGDINGSQSVVVRDSANIDGNIFSPIVTLLEGATFNGSIDMSGKSAADSGTSGGNKAQDRSAGNTSRNHVSAQDSDRGDDKSQGNAKKKSQRHDKNSASAA